MKKLLLILALPAFLLAGCTMQNFKSDDLGVTVKTSAGIVRLEPASGGDIIRVTALPAGEKLTPRQSLITAYERTPLEGWSVEETDGKVVLRTASVEARVGLDDGLVAFFDADGEAIISEATRTFSPVEYGGKKAFELTTAFDSDPAEGLYGLGQHQSDEWNYKGRNEELYQYNTKVSVPMIVSTGGYGILWDNYSYSRFGDPRPYSELDELFTLTGTDGTSGALTATYNYFEDGYAAQKPTTLVRGEAKIDYQDLDAVETFPVNLAGAHVTWEGTLTAPESGTYHFILYYAGYTTVSVDGAVIVPERWRTAWNPNSYKFTVDMTAGEPRRLLIDWKPDGGASYMGLKALSPRPAEEQNRLAMWSEMGDRVEYYFIKGDNLDGVVKGYRTLTGKAQVMPKWAMGFWQSRERYKTQDELLDALREYRKRGIPVDNMVQDWSYWPVDAWGSHDFDPERFPDPKGMVDEVHAMDARIMISVWPKFYHTTDNYKAFDEKGWMYNRAVRDSIKDWIWPGYIGGFYDAFVPEARELFWGQMNEKLYSLGMDAWWMDASEPDILSNASMPYRKELMNPFSTGVVEEFFNAYALVNAQAIYKGQRSVAPNERVFLLTRSGFAGLQRYSTATWSGDIGTRWEDMKAQIPAGLNFALSGIPWWTMDIGGFCVENRYAAAREGSADMEEWRELNTRWFQFGAFCPLFRSHGQYPTREIYNLAPEGHPAYNSMVWYDKLRYRLMPYIYSLAGRVHFDDYTVMRALVMDFADDPAVFDIGDQYMFGPSLLVCPVYEYKARSREVYLPEGAWWDFNTGMPVEGGRTIEASAPYERMPMFVRAGAIIPMGGEVASTATPQNDLRVEVWPGADGSFTIYEDEGTNYDYEKGEYSTIPLTWSDAEGTLTIGERTGSWEGMPSERTFTVVVHSADGKTLSPKTIEWSGAKTDIHITK
jgi:alpha-D-xyloside xylohydrolase